MALTLIGCGATLPKVKPYKMDIQQGNVVTSEMLLKLRPGMTKSQVKFIMGTPLLVDSFRTNRWDYFYQLRKQGKIVNQRRVILDFEDDLLKRVRGDVVPKGKTVEDVKKELEQEASEKQEADTVESPDTEVQAMEAPAIEATENLTESSEMVDSGEAEPASVLAVPVEPAPVEDIAPSKAEPVQQEAVEAAEEKAEEVAKEAEPVMTKEAPAAVTVPVIEPEPSAKPSKKVLKVLPSKAEKKLIFRMDRNLDTTRIIPQEVSTSETPLPESVVQEVKDAEENLPEEDPSFFERMLEKIGF